MPAADQIEVTVTLGWRDIQRASFSMARSSTRLWRSLLVAVVLSAILFPVLSLAYRDTRGLGWMAVVGVLFGVLLWLVLTPLMILITYLLSLFNAYSLSRKNAHALGPVTYRFSDRGCAYSSASANGEQIWNGYLKVQETREFFLFYFLKHSATIVPKRFFIDDRAMNELKGILRGHFKGELKLS